VVLALIRTSTGVADSTPAGRNWHRLSRSLRDCEVWRRPHETQRHCLEVLHDGREVELVACAGEAAQPQPLEAVMGLQGAKRISTRFLSSRDLANALVFIFWRATSRASSCRSRGILRAASFVQHLALRGQTSQPRLEAR
jgi:hypothetical protein